MTPLELLTIFSLYSNKPLLDSVESSEFMASATVDALKADGKSAMIALLRSEFGLEWDGNGMMSHFVVGEQRKIDARKLALKRIVERRQRLHLAELALQYPVLAGAAEVDKALLELQE
jgi:hypothetical protein